MPRGSSSPSRSSSSPSRNYNSSKPPPPLQTTNIPKPKSNETKTSESSGGGFIGSITQGFGFGIGSSIARRVFGSTTPEYSTNQTTTSSPNLSHYPTSKPTYSSSQSNSTIQDTQLQTNSCEITYKKWQECFETNANCDKLYTEYLNCKENN